MKEVWILGAEMTSLYISSYKELGDYFAYSKITLPNDTILNYLGPRYAKKIDRSVQLSVYATEQLLKKVPLSEIDKERTGIMLGNNYAGWSYVEEQMYGLYQGDHYAINPYVATAWFPAAAQGELSIRNRLYGISKTFSQDKLSAAVATDFAVDMIRTGKIDYAVTGGYESLRSPLIQVSLKENGLVSDTYPASEAACSLLLSGKYNDHKSAIAKIRCLHRGNLKVVLAKTRQMAPNIDLVLVTSMNTTKNNQQRFSIEKVAISEQYGQHIQIEIPTQSMGEVGGASFVLELTVALWILEKRGLQTVMVIGRDYDFQQYCALVIERAN